MKVLFMHSNFPAQFVNIAGYMGNHQGYQPVFLTARKEGRLAGVGKAIFEKARDAAAETHHYLRGLENAVLEGQAAFRSGLALKEQGFVPDLIVGHSGWGSTLYMKDLFPTAKMIGYFEWFYRAHGSDADFDSAEPMSADGECRIRMKNAPILMDLDSCDAGLSPTQYQRSQFPAEYQDKITVLHDGVKADYYHPVDNAKLILPHLSLNLSEVDELVTYVGRGMEPYRGFPQFMEAIDILLKRRPRCHVVIVGANRVAYGRQDPSGKTYKQLMLEKLDLDLTRVHFTGVLPHAQYRQVLQASTAHVYLTRPFVLSWSMIEAMSTGCLIVGSSTAPVKEVIEDKVNGLLADFFSPADIADKLEQALVYKQEMRSLRAKARETVLERYDLKKLLPEQLAFLQRVAEGQRESL